MPEHAPLFARKLFAARIAVSSAFADIDEVVMSVHEIDGATQARDTLFSGLKRSSTGLSPTQPSHNDERLDKYLSRQVQTRLVGCKTNATAVSDSRLLARLQHIEDRLSTINCDTCSGHVVGKLPCSAVPDDDVVVSAKGECIREIADIFVWARDFSASVYDQALGSKTTSVAKLIDCQLATSSNPNTLMASTAFAGASVPQSLVQLNFPEAPGTADFATIPYALTHELIAHAYLGALANEARTQRGAFDEWSEGWMDCIAYRLLRDHVEHIGLVAALPFPPFTQLQLMHATDEGHRARYSPDVAPPPPGNALREARARFFAMEGRVRRCIGLEGSRTMLRALLVLNASGAARETVNQLLAASAFFRHGQADNSAELTADERQVFQALVRYRDHRNESMLLAELFI